MEDVNNGDVLAAASYPTYDLNDYYDKYDELISNPRNPLWSRFAMGTYAPGSTFKPVVASASLEEGTISADTIFNCGGRMKYRGQPFKCLRGNAHGSENVKTALRDSCNIFFYNCAMRVGISKIDEYASAFGLGEKQVLKLPNQQVYSPPLKTEKITAAYGMPVIHFKLLSAKVITFSLRFNLQTTVQQLQTAEQDMTFIL